MHMCEHVRGKVCTLHCSQSQNTLHKGFISNVLCRKLFWTIHLYLLLFFSLRQSLLASCTLSLSLFYPPVYSGNNTYVKSDNNTKMTSWWKLIPWSKSFRLQFLTLGQKRNMGRRNDLTIQPRQEENVNLALTTAIWESIIPNDFLCVN